MLNAAWRDLFVRHAQSADADLAVPALCLGRVEHASIDLDAYLSRLDAMAGQVSARTAGGRSDASPASRVAILNQYLFEELGFSGNQARYDDPRNSFLNDVLDRRTGIPISLAVLYIEVARRAGIPAEGVGFPGHFLVRVLPAAPSAGDPAVLVDVFHRGAVLSDRDCRQLLPRTAGPDVPFDDSFLDPSTKLQVLQRMLTNLKRLYVRYRSFPQARAVTDLIVAINPHALDELRDRGLLASHLDDYAPALRDLESWLQAVARRQMEDEERRESEQIWEHVKGLRKRLAELN